MNRSLQHDSMVRSSFRDKTHVDWCKAWVQTLTELQQYVRQNHTTGLVWAKTGTVPAPPSLTGIPPPPPPTNMPIADMPPVMNDDRNALFAEINRGEDITKSKFHFLFYAWKVFFNL